MFFSATRFKNCKGFILPMATMMVVILAISGTSFLHLDYLERRMVMNEVGNMDSFYLASTGIERARATMKIPLDPPNWTSVLDDTHPNHPAEYPTDPSPNPLLCPDVSMGCVIPPFQTAALNSSIAANGDAIDAPDLPFSGTFNDGVYTARLFNNGGAGDVGKVDADQSLTVRAIGNVRGHEKLIEADIVAVADMDLINCQGNVGDPCPDTINGTPQQVASEGHESSSHPVLPTLTDPDPSDAVLPLLDPNSYYRSGVIAALGLAHRGSFPPGDLVLSDTPGGSEVLLQPNSYYFHTGDITVKQSAGTDHVVVFSLANVNIKGVVLSNAIFIANQEVRLQGNATITAPLPHPAIISGGTVDQSAGSVNVTGNVYSAGAVDLNPNSVHGILIGSPVTIRGGAGTLFTDDDPRFYALMPGFTYPNGTLSTAVIPGSWKEIE